MAAVDIPFQQQIHHLYADHHPWLLSWLRRRLGCPHGAADLAHDAFVRLLGSRDVSGLREPRAYLATTANRLIIDRARRHRIEEAYLAELALTAENQEGHPSPEQIITAVEALDHICRVIEGLAAKPRQAFLLHYLDGLTHAIIAGQLGVSTKTVQKYLIRALLHCHRALDG